jgi:hypothetical protein
MAEEVMLTVKYVSSPRLLRLQLQDAALRRHFLVQVEYIYMLKAVGCAQLALREDLCTRLHLLAMLIAWQWQWRLQ